MHAPHSNRVAQPALPHAADLAFPSACMRSLSSRRCWWACSRRQRSCRPQPSSSACTSTVRAVPCLLAASQHCTLQPLFLQSYPKRRTLPAGSHFRQVWTLPQTAGTVLQAPNERVSLLQPYATAQCCSLRQGTSHAPPQALHQSLYLQQRWLTRVCAACSNAVAPCRLPLLLKHPTSVCPRCSPGPPERLRRLLVQRLCGRVHLPAPDPSHSAGGRPHRGRPVCHRCAGEHLPTWGTWGVAGLCLRRPPASGSKSQARCFRVAGQESGQMLLSSWAALRPAACLCDTCRLISSPESCLTAVTLPMAACRWMQAQVRPRG